MAELITLGGAAVAAYLSKDGVSKLLGPTAEYLGGELKDLVEKSQRNIASVFQRAERKCGPKIETEGVVNPRVMKHVYDEARFCENELLAEYFGGVLASARTDDGQDDRGVYYSQIVQSMSTFQLRMHYFFYYLIWLNSKGRQLDLNGYSSRHALSIIVPVACYEATFGITDRTSEMSVIAHSLSGLSRSDLIEQTFHFSSPDELKKNGVEVDQHAFLIGPTITGLELFIWAHGRGEKGLNAFLSLDLIGCPDLEIKLPELTRLKEKS